ncbi:MAG: hypothetical protein M3R26_00015 [Actinomycetota bacterium]|nr:hypothetical protein [Actinomycetota bacterium]MDQ2980703.1 hypothetical protein [Actinomycetota bacterium]
MTDLLEQHLARTVNPLDDSDWLSVRRPVRLPRKRVALLAAAAVAAALLVAPAFGLGDRVLDLLQGPPAPPEVQTYFAADNAMRERMLAEAPAATHSLRERVAPVIVGEARGVAAIESPDGPIYLWAAPTEDGRQCWLIQAGADPATGRPYGAGTCEEQHPGGAIVPETFWTAERPSIQILHARVYDEAITRVDVEVEGSDSVSLPVVSGHALGTVSKEARVEAFVGRNADGDEVARSTTPEAG